MRRYQCQIALCLLALWWTVAALAHGVAADDVGYIQSHSGVAFIPFLYLGAKHMVTGYDHLLFLAGVVFFLYRMKDVALYVTLFAVGHSLTLMLGLLADVHVNTYLVDAIIGLSVVYKAFENMGGFARIGIQADTRLMVWLFGLAHGFGLSTKLQALALSQEGLVLNMLGFNLGVEVGQLLALTILLLVLTVWRRTPSFTRWAYLTNAVIMTAGFTLFGYQLTGYFHFV